jgi:hypothetical protein
VRFRYFTSGSGALYLDGDMRCRQRSDESQFEIVSLFLPFVFWDSEFPPYAVDNKKRHDPSAPPRGHVQDHSRYEKVKTSAVFASENLHTAEWAKTLSVPLDDNTGRNSLAEICIGELVHGKRCRIKLQVFMRNLV